jgi:hypothetical protein
MRHSFSIFTIVALCVSAAVIIWRDLDADEKPTAVGAGSKPNRAPSSGNASGDVLLDTAAAALRAKTTVSARVRFQINLLGHQIFGSGKYLQKGRAPHLRSRLELTAQTSSNKITLRHVNDGIHWWQYQDFGHQAEFSYVNLEAVRDEMANNKREPAGLPHSDLALGGLPRLLASVRSQFQLTSAVQVRRNAETAWRVTGTWHTEIQAEKSASANSPARQKYSHVPDSVVIYFDASSFFPSRFEFYRQAADATPKLLVAMELYEVQFEAAIDDAQFAQPQPSEMIPKDVTDDFLQQLRVSASSNPVD